MAFGDRRPIGAQIVMVIDKTLGNRTVLYRSHSLSITYTKINSNHTIFLSYLPTPYRTPAVLNLNGYRSK